MSAHRVADNNGIFDYMRRNFDRSSNQLVIGSGNCVPPHNAILNTTVATPSGSITCSAGHSHYWKDVTLAAPLILISAPKPVTLKLLKHTFDAFQGWEAHNAVAVEEQGGEESEEQARRKAGNEGGQPSQGDSGGVKGGAGQGLGGEVEGNQASGAHGVTAGHAAEHKLELLPVQGDDQGDEGPLAVVLHHPGQQPQEPWYYRVLARAVLQLATGIINRGAMVLVDVVALAQALRSKDALGVVNILTPWIDGHPRLRWLRGLRENPAVLALLAAALAAVVPQLSSADPSRPGARFSENNDGGVTAPRVGTRPLVPSPAGGALRSSGRLRSAINQRNNGDLGRDGGRQC